MGATEARATDLSKTLSRKPRRRTAWAQDSFDVKAFAKMSAAIAMEAVKDPSDVHAVRPLHMPKFGKTARPYICDRGGTVL